jgi:hypothetical protein
LAEPPLERGPGLLGRQAGALPARPTPADCVPAFGTVFRWTIPFMVLALVLALAMPEKPLSGEMIEVAQAKAEVPEY